jgi:hypothetical protein
MGHDVMRHVTKVNQTAKSPGKMSLNRALRPAAYHIMASPPHARPSGARANHKYSIPFPVSVPPRIPNAEFQLIGVQPGALCGEVLKEME